MNPGENSDGVLCAGETMALVTPTTADRLRTADLFHLDAAGAESNVAAHLAALGRSAAWFSRLGDDELGKRVAATIAKRGVDVSPVIFDTRAPTGVYFKDPGHRMFYYRGGSAASLLSAEDAELMKLDDVRILHVSGITAALSDSAAGFLSEAIGRARRAGVLISFDVNYRSLLWPSGEAGLPLRQLAERADLVFVGRDEAQALWGTKTPEAIRELFPNVASLVVKDGEQGATEFHRVETVFEPSEKVNVVEAIGAGDAFAGGYLAGVLAGKTTSECLREGHQRAALTLQTTTDFVHQMGSIL